MQNDWSQNLEGSGEAETVQDILSSLFSMQAGGAPQRQSSDGRRIISLSGISLQNLSRLLGGRVISGSSDRRTYLGEDGDDDDDYEDDDDGYYGSLRNFSQWFPPTTEPQPAGVNLLNSGDFGSVATKLRSRRNEQNLAKTILNRNSRPVPRIAKEEYTANLVPNTNGTAVARYEANIYTGQFSGDSSFYYTCSQDFRLHIFDMKAPLSQSGPIPTPRVAGIRHDTSLKTSMPIRKTIQGHPGRWTITDANLSPDNERMIYSSIAPTVYMTSTAPEASNAQIPISFADPPSRSRHLFNYTEGLGIWSCRFSADGNEVVAGGSGKIFVYDLLANRRTVKISAHTDDVNSCCWADTASGNVLVSASDDTFLKVWDRRSLGASQKPSGVLIGHTEGITYVSAKGDGRYIISNGKDQAMRLWDLRKMRSSQEFEAVEAKHYGLSNFDYRDPYYPKPKYAAHPKDCSVMTYRGHAVLRTLIRCHFSPAETTGSQYLYSGSANGKIHIWSLDGRIVQVLDRAKTLPETFAPSGPELEPIGSVNSCVRDVSWHSQEPVMLSAGWDNVRGGSVVARHEWKGLSKMPGALEDWVEKKRLENAEGASERRHHMRLRRRQRVPGAFDDEDDGEDNEVDD